MTVVAFAEKNKAAAQIASILGDGEVEKIDSRRAACIRI